MRAMRITAITPQRKRSDRCSVYIDDEFVFGASQDEIVRLGLHTGQEIDGSELEKLQREVEYGQAYRRALSYLEIRPRSHKEIAGYLNTKGFDVGTVQAVVNKLAELELVDDAWFAREWVQWRRASKSRSRRQLQAELYKKGIAPELIEAALDGIGREEEIATIRDIINRKSHQYQDRRRLNAYLSRQGFHYEDVAAAWEDAETD